MRDPLLVRLNACPRAASRQQGVALAIGLIFLLITTLIALSAMSGVVMQERMAGNLRNVSIARGAAESALRAGEIFLAGVISRGEEILGECGDGGLHQVFDRSNSACDTTQIDAFRSSRDSPGNAGGAAHDYPASLINDGQLSDPDFASMAARPQFVIEHMGDFYPGTGGEWEYEGSYGTQAPRVYRITARGTGVTASVIRVIESQFAMVAGGGGGGLCPDGITPMPPSGDPDDCP